MYLFDTDILSNIVKKKPSSILVEKLQHLSKTVQFTTSINIGEIYFGAYRSPRKTIILKAFREKVFPNVNILSFDSESGRVFGLLKAELEKTGIGCSEPDLRIASIAIQHQLFLITGNIKHFKLIPGLKIENWLEEYR
ncbi:MAG: type II toxin-antitoxin system VapC family toxin [Candidatus Aminicenantes bacterium]|nr:type II toxin-antitoxin system VapC family toxin [Candidatus Aminicenantes bacterium]